MEAEYSLFLSPSLSNALLLLIQAAGGCTSLALLSLGDGSRLCGRGLSPHASQNPTNTSR